MRDETDEILPKATKEQSVKLKQLGFDWETEWAYQQDRLVHDSRNLDRKNWNSELHVDCSSPVVPLAVKWLRDVKRSMLT